MKEKKLLEAMSHVNEEFVEEAAPEIKKKPRLRTQIVKWGGMAACLVLMLSVALTVPGMLFSGCGAGAPVKGGGYLADTGFSGGAMREEMMGAAPMDMEAAEEEMEYSEDMDYSDNMADYEGGELETTTTAESAYQRADVKLIRRASLTMEATDFDSSVASLSVMVEQFGGYIEDSNLYQGSYGTSHRSASYVVRIPSEHYGDFLHQITDKTGCHLTYKSENTEDVGQQYFDTETRLETLRTKLNRLQALLKKAEVMEDIITLESAISDTEYEINLYTSTLNHYNSLIGYSTFKIDLEEVSTLSDTDTISFGQRLLNALSRGWEDFIIALQDSLVWLMGALPVLLAAGAVVMVVVVVWKRRKK